MVPLPQSAMASGSMMLSRSGHTTETDFGFASPYAYACAASKASNARGEWGEWGLCGARGRRR